MGLLQNGQWVDKWYDTKTTKGRFQRKPSQFREKISADGSTPYPAESGRYHLFVSYACPWAHRTLIFRALKGLEDHISVNVVDPVMLKNGWECQGEEDGMKYLYELYLKADPNYEGRVTVPVLWDKKTQTIVNNESSEIIRMLNTEFNGITGNTMDFCPDELLQEIDEVNDYVYHNVNNGVYRAGFATEQEAYDEAVKEVFAALDHLERRLSQQTFLVGEQLTESDWRLFATLIRFDAVYVGHFKCNIRRIADYPALSQYLRRLYNHPGVAETVHFDHIKSHYYASHASINPTGIVPVGPELNLEEELHVKS